MRMDKPDVDHISGLCPAVAIEQKVVTRTPRSTVGSMTEIYEFLRLLFARIGRTISPISGKEVKKDDVGDVLQAIRQLKAGDKIQHTQDAVVLEKLISQFLYNKASENNKSDTKAAE